MELGPEKQSVRKSTYHINLLIYIFESLVKLIQF